MSLEGGSYGRDYLEDGSNVRYFQGTPLTVGAGWAMVVGFAVVFMFYVFAILVVFQYFEPSQAQPDTFANAGRILKPGLAATIIVAQWTWAATFLQSSNVGYRYGIAGPYWYAAGASVQVVLFGVLAVQLKRRAPQASTLPEVIRLRWGTAAHIVFLCFSLATNIIVTSMLLLGAARTIEAATGFSAEAAAVLLPVSISIYTAAGGLRATCISSYTHCVLVYIIINILVFKVFFSRGPFPDHDIDCHQFRKEFDHVFISNPPPSASLAASQTSLEPAFTPASLYRFITKLFPHPPPEPSDPLYLGPHKTLRANAASSPLTMLAPNAALFGMVSLLGNFGTVFLDQSFWQAAIASSPAATYRAYLFAGLGWFAIPFCFGTAITVAAHGLGLHVSLNEADEGLLPAAVLTELWGCSGAWVILVLVVMAVVSTGSSEQVAVTSLLSYDVYRTYLAPHATPIAVLRVQRLLILAFGMVSGLITVVLFELNLSLAFLYQLMGILVSPAVVPVVFALTWSECSAASAISGSVAGVLAGLVAWVLIADGRYGGISMETLGREWSMFGGNLVAVVVSAVVCVLTSCLWPESFAWEDMLAVNRLADRQQEEPLPPAVAKSATKFTVKSGALVVLLLLVLWPVCVTPAHVFSQGYFTFWLLLVAAWALVAGAVMVFVPLYEYRDEGFDLAKGVARVLGARCCGFGANGAMEFYPEASHTTNPCAPDDSSVAASKQGAGPRAAKSNRGVVWQGTGNHPRGITLVARLPGTGRPSGESSTRWRPSLEIGRPGQPPRGFFQQVEGPSVVQPAGLDVGIRSGERLFVV